MQILIHLFTCETFSWQPLTTWKLFDRYYLHRRICEMAAVSKPFETNGDSKEVILGKKIAELKKRLVLSGNVTIDKKFFFIFRSIEV